MKFVVTGSARSGTKYASRLLTYAGLLTGHEDAFSTWTSDYGLVDNWDRPELDGESSFIAAPFVRDINDAGLHIVHQIRPPLDVINSLVGIGWLDNHRLPYVKFVAKHAPSVLNFPVGAQRAAEYWLRWNELVHEQADASWRVGEINKDDITALADTIGIKLTKSGVARAVERVSPLTNHRARGNIDLSQLGAQRAKVEQAAEFYGLPLTI